MLAQRSENTRALCMRRLLPAACVPVCVVAALAVAGAAHAGTYQINNCPSAPVPNGDAGAWVILAGQQGSKASCGGGAGDYIGPRGANMSPGTIDGVQISTPAGSTVTISEAKVWWYVPRHASGATTFALASATNGIVGESATPLDRRIAPDVFVLASSTTSFILADYCANDDAGQGCALGPDETPNLQLFGSQLTLADSRLPSGTVTGGGLAGAGPLSATQAILYDAEDSDSGVRVVQLLIDGQVVAQNDYAAQCPYASFLACPAGESDMLDWNTAVVRDGQHGVALVVQSAAQNRQTIFAGTVTTHNAPTNLTPPTIGGQAQPPVASALSGTPGVWASPAGAGSTSYSEQWESCEADGSRCTTISGAVGATYTPTSGDVGRTLRMLVSAANYDGASTALSAATRVVASAASAEGAGAGVPRPAVMSGVAPNGSAASEGARMRLGVRGPLVRTFALRALRLPGTLVNSGGQPIAGASVDVLARDAGGGRMRVLAHARTGPDGSFVANVPGGSSRLLEVAYRTFDSDAAYSARASVVETVRAGVALRVTPRRPASTGTIRLSGQVQGPIPAHGVIVELLVHYRGRWEPLRTPRTGREGRFAASYQFQGAVGRFPFRAEVFGGQSGFPYSLGASNLVNVTTR
jgi:hypothetical protein